jgi:hypothetical protein
MDAKRNSADCDPVRLTRFIQGDLPQAEMEQVLAHLEACPACHKVFEDLVRLRAAAPEIRAGLSSRFHLTAPVRSPVRRWVFTYGAAAAVLGGLVLGLFVMRGYLLRQADPLSALLETKPFTYVAPVLRGPESPSPDPAREAMMERYAAGEYGPFVEAAAGWLRSHPDDAQVMFFAGVAAYLDGKPDVAAVYLDWNLSTHRLRRPETLWYLANARLRQRQSAAARPLLEELAHLDHPYAPRAAEILRHLPAK